MDEGGPDGCRFVAEEGKLEDRAVLAQLGSVGRTMAQARSCSTPCIGCCQCSRAVIGKDTAGRPGSPMTESQRSDKQSKPRRGSNPDHSHEKGEFVFMSHFSGASSQSIVSNSGAQDLSCLPGQTQLQQGCAQTSGAGCSVHWVAMRLAIVSCACAIPLHVAG